MGMSNVWLKAGTSSLRIESAQCPFNVYGAREPYQAKVNTEEPNASRATTIIVAQWCAKTSFMSIEIGNAISCKS